MWYTVEPGVDVLPPSATPPTDTSATTGDGDGCGLPITAVMSIGSAPANGLAAVDRRGNRLGDTPVAGAALALTEGEAVTGGAAAVMAAAKAVAAKCGVRCVGGVAVAAASAAAGRDAGAGR